ncbi:hypothetical protein [Kitasatospora paranensis]|uniref:hypothetical protein n=1 Tax=Kitasatospora paranensis TaxID=258053 RepID=UPI0031ECD34A
MIRDAGHTIDLAGYRVDATDGHLGRVDRHSDYVDEQHIVVDTGVWVFGREISLPMTAVAAVDERHRIVTLALSKAEVAKVYQEQTSRLFGADTRKASTPADPAAGRPADEGHDEKPGQDEGQHSGGGRAEGTGRPDA